MFGNLKPQAPDKILALMGEFRADPRQGKIDLGVGVYKDPTGLTPVMRAVKEAERRIWEAETTKSYTALTGEPAYLDALSAMVLGKTRDSDRTAMLSTVGGTGAIRQAFEMARMGNPDLTVHVSDPTWPMWLVRRRPSGRSRLLPQAAIMCFSTGRPVSARQCWPSGSPGCCLT